MSHLEPFARACLILNRSLEHVVSFFDPNPHAVLHTVLGGVMAGGLLLPEHYEDCIFRQGLEVLGILHLRPGERVH